MDLQYYMENASKTAKFDTKNFNMEEMFYVACGLNGEAGEVAEKTKKIWRDSDSELTDDRRDALIKELGDVLWYWSQCCSILGVDPNEVAQRNLDKLAKRQAENKIHGDGDNR